MHQPPPAQKLSPTSPEAPHPSAYGPMTGNAAVGAPPQATAQLPLPAGWAQAVAADGRTYYVQMATQQTQWTFPAAAPVPQQHLVPATPLQHPAPAATQPGGTTVSMRAGRNAHTATCPSCQYTGPTQVKRSRLTATNFLITIFTGCWCAFLHPATSSYKHSCSKW